MHGLSGLSCWLAGDTDHRPRCRACGWQNRCDRFNERTIVFRAPLGEVVFSRQALSDDATEKELAKMETHAPFVVVGAFTLAAIGAVFGFVYWLHNTGGLGTRTSYTSAAVLPLRSRRKLVFTALDDIAEQLPLAAREPHHLHVFQRREILLGGICPYSRD